LDAKKDNICIRNLIPRIFRWLLANGYKTTNANGHFEFMVKRNNEDAFIVEAKKDDNEQRMVHDLVGMDVFPIWMGWIVTNYIE
jgi:hypothetical protein